MSYPLWLRRRWMSLSRKNYFPFADKEVTRVVANKIGDGIGTTIEQMLAVGSMDNTWFYQNTSIVTFKELSDFSNLTSIGVNGFRDCSYLTEISLPNSLRTLGNLCFMNCTRLKKLVIPSSVTSYSNGLFTACSGLEELRILGNPSFTLGNFIQVNTSFGKNTGSLYFGGSVAKSTYSNYTFNFKKVVFVGDFLPNFGGGRPYLNGSAIVEARFGGDVDCDSDGTVYSNNVKFIECMGQFTHATRNLIRTPSGLIYHLGYGSVNGTPALLKLNTSGVVSMVYVGDGSSKSGDESVLSLYLADSGYSSYSSRLSIWWDYNGQYRTYRVSENLTNCTNSNTVSFPFITRGESYETVISANEGCVLTNVQVLMYDAQDNGVTPDNPTDITSTAYDSTTGTISIEHVTGNITINATAE